MSKLHGLGTVEVPRLRRNSGCSERPNDLKENPQVQMEHNRVALVIILMLAASACAMPAPEPTAAPALSEADTEYAAAGDGDIGDAAFTEDRVALTDADVAFLDKTADLADGYAATFASLDEHIDLIIDDSSLFDDETWLATSAEILGSISLLNHEVRALDSPLRCQPVHARLLEAADHYESFVTLYGEGIEELNGEKIDRAVDEMVAGTDTIHDATQRIDELLK